MHKIYKVNQKAVYKMFHFVAFLPNDVQLPTPTPPTSMISTLIPTHTVEVTTQTTVVGDKSCS